MNEKIANLLVENNGLQIVTKHFIDHNKQQVFINLLRNIINFSTNKTIIDVNSLFHLSKLSPGLQDLTFKKLVELSKVETDLNGRQKQYDLQFENYIQYLTGLIKNTQDPKDG